MPVTWNVMSWRVGIKGLSQRGLRVNYHTELGFVRLYKAQHTLSFCPLSYLFNCPLCTAKPTPKRFEFYLRSNLLFFVFFLILIFFFLISHLFIYFVFFISLWAWYIYIPVSLFSLSSVGFIHFFKYSYIQFFCNFVIFLDWFWIQSFSEASHSWIQLFSEKRF